MKVLNKMQRRAALWILGVFKISSLFGMEAIVGLMPIHLHLCKLSGRSQLRAYLLSDNHILKSLMELRPNISCLPYQLSLGFLTKCQLEIIKGLIVDIDNQYNEIFSSFDLLNPEFAPGQRIINSFSSCFSFHSFNKYNNNSLAFQSH